MVDRRGSLRFGRKPEEEKERRDRQKNLDADPSIGMKRLDQGIGRRRQVVHQHQQEREEAEAVQRGKVERRSLRLNVSASPLGTSS